MPSPQERRWKERFGLFWYQSFKRSSGKGRAEGKRSKERFSLMYSFIEQEIKEAEERGYQRGLAENGCLECLFNTKNGHSFVYSKFKD